MRTRRTKTGSAAAAACRSSRSPTSADSRGQGRSDRRTKPETGPSTPLLLSSLSLCAATSLLRQASLFPIGKTFPPLNLRPGYLPQYILSYYFGTTVRDPLNAVPTTSQTLLLSAISAISGAVVIKALRDPQGHGLLELQIGEGMSILAIGYAV